MVLYLELRKENARDDGEKNINVTFIDPSKKFTKIIIKKGRVVGRTTVLGISLMESQILIMRRKILNLHNE